MPTLVEKIKAKMQEECDAAQRLQAGAAARGVAWFNEAESAEAARLKSSMLSLKEQLAEAQGKQELMDRIGSIGEFMARGSGEEDAAAYKTLGAPNLIPSIEDLRLIQKAALEGQSFRKAIGFKASIDTVAAPMSAVGSYQVNNVFEFLRDRPRVLDRIPVQPTNAPSVFYYQGTTAASAAAPVAEGAAKPESSPVWTQVQAVVRKIAHYTRANDEVIADFPGFLQLIGQELIAGLIDAENDQLINGSGTAPAIRGLLNVSGILTRARGADTNLDAIEKSFTDLRTGTSFTEPDTIIMNPANYDTIRLAKDSQLRYLAGDPLRSGPSQLWGVPVVLTTKIAANTAIVANLKAAATVYLRQPPTVETNMMGGTTEFIANQTLIRAEERLTLAVQRPTAVLKLTGLN